MKRQIIKIDEAKCTGCGACIPGCPEGALQIIDGKARLVSDLFCDGLGACLGTCPEGAIEVEEREAEPYSEAIVMKNIMAAGENTIKAHLNHLKSHGETTYYSQALEILKASDFNIECLTTEETMACGCSGTHARSITPAQSPHTAGSKNPLIAESNSTQAVNELRQWPVQLTLINPAAEYLENCDLLISADCVPYAFGGFHGRFLKGKIVITFCPKLDNDIEGYIDKLAQIFTLHTVKSVTIVRMEVPCCGGTEVILKRALEKSGKLHFVKVYVVSVDGTII
ncbi:MAG: 4Fe-4S dicluster domain-containing protein [Candidatus Cloacimonetes bacterium]|nr:4Fe-4S dicluster domain-containing protein [Candidatus Cloacimonadota bacterium]